MEIDSININVWRRAYCLEEERQWIDSSHSPWENRESTLSSAIKEVTSGLDCLGISSRVSEEVQSLDRLMISSKEKNNKALWSCWEIPCPSCPSYFPFYNRTPMHTFVCVFVCMCVCLRTCVCIYLYVCTGGNKLCSLKLFKCLKIFILWHCLYTFTVVRDKYCSFKSGVCNCKMFVC